MTCLDSSFLVSLYMRDAHSSAAASIAPLASGPLVVTPWAQLETENTFELRVFRNEASRMQADASLQNFRQDLRSGILELRDLPASTFDSARQLSVRFSSSSGTRAGDVLDVAAAQEIGATDFFSFDLQQRAMAQAVGLKLNPMTKP